VDKRFLVLQNQCRFPSLGRNRNLLSNGSSKHRCSQASRLLLLQQHLSHLLRQVQSCQTRKLCNQQSIKLNSIKQHAREDAIIPWSVQLLWPIIQEHSSRFLSLHSNNFNSLKCLFFRTSKSIFLDFKIIRNVFC
jgi:hypothetical protein